MCACAQSTIKTMVWVDAIRAVNSQEGLLRQGEPRNNLRLSRRSFSLIPGVQLTDQERNPMSVDYNDASKTYDHTRDTDSDLINLFDEKLHFTESINILDFGCGTGNYLYSIHQKYPPQCFGVEPSDGMLKKALLKNPELSIRKGDHNRIPFEDAFFHFIYMTDVIHHVPDLDALFKNLFRKLVEGGLACIVTESHSQIDTRWYKAYFPSLAKNEKKRYPDVAKIVGYATRIGFCIDEIQIKPAVQVNAVTDHFIKMVEEKNYSMFRLLEESEYQAGLKNLHQDRGKSITTTQHGGTLIWLRK
jgi:ubiquinone/menaquinone biosynthesis C-methylase UbiE